jgi:diguanylate cyclase (GGDEF)-like protein/PAS domain S-box-containing protein
MDDSMNKHNLIVDANNANAYLRSFLNQLKDNDNKTALTFYVTLFQTVLDNAPVGIYIMQGGVFTYVNNYYCKLMGYTSEELISGKVELKQIVHPEDFPIIQSNIEKRMKAIGEKEERYTIRNYTKNGCLIHAEIHASVTEINGQSILFGSVIDITEQVLIQLELEESKERWKSLFYSSPDAIFSLDEDGRFTSANPASELITGYSKAEILEMSFSPMIISEDLPKAIHNFEESKKGIPTNVELVIVRKDGNKIYLNVSLFPMNVNGSMVGTYGTARDTTQKFKYDQQLEQFAFYDFLTKLPNRKLFEDRLDQVLKLSRADRRSIAVLFIDLDRFKFINDSLGHHLGDEFLIKVSVRLMDCIRMTDTISRLAGDEFAVLLPDVYEEEVAKGIAEQMNKALMEPFQVGGHSVNVTASIGIAFSKGIEQSVHELIRNADTAMYHAKKNKKNSYSIYSKVMDEKAIYRLTLERDLLFAIDQQQLELYYQPIIDLKTKQVTAMEALIRWHHPQLGLIPPGDFIPIAEESGQIIAIGRWVMQTACRQASLWQASGIAPFKMAVNISTKQLQDDSFIDSVILILSESNLAPKWLELEVTESILLDDVALIKESLIRLKQTGISISIDDFGTGYTSLSYLRQYPFDKVKIDRCFIDDISLDMNGKRIASAIISLAHSLNMEVLAEGIENEVELKYLVEELCDEGQGYYFSRPLPAHLLKLDPGGE